LAMQLREGLDRIYLPQVGLELFGYMPKYMGS